MGKTTFVLPDDLHNEISAAVRKRGVNINIAVNQAVNMWPNLPPSSPDCVPPSALCGITDA
jgi:hypothetical protein